MPTFGIAISVFILEILFRKHIPPASTLTKCYGSGTPEDTERCSSCILDPEEREEPANHLRCQPALMEVRPVEMVQHHWSGICSPQGRAMSKQRETSQRSNQWSERVRWLNGTSPSTRRTSSSTGNLDKVAKGLPWNSKFPLIVIPLLLRSVEALLK